VKAGVSDETVRLMDQHMENFEADHSTFSADFTKRTEALLALTRHRTDLAVRYAALCTNSLHSADGNAAHWVLQSIDALLQLSRLLLANEGDAAYRQAKLRTAERYLGYAKEYLGKP
jgi:hypothetical protein